MGETGFWFNLCRWVLFGILVVDQKDGDGAFIW